MDQSITKPDDLPEGGHLALEAGIFRGGSTQGFSDDLELTFNRGA
jgi:hypothetical protein